MTDNDNNEYGGFTQSATVNRFWAEEIEERRSDEAERDIDNDNPSWE